MLDRIYRLKQKLTTAYRFLRWGVGRLSSGHNPSWLLTSAPGEPQFQVVVKGNQCLADNCFAYFFAHRGLCRQLDPAELAATVAAADLQVVEPMPWQLGKADLFCSTVYASTAIGTDLDSFISARLSSTMRRRVRKALKLNYQVSRCEDKAALSEFYHQLYLPMVSRRHGDNCLDASEHYFTANPSRVMDKLLLTVALEPEKEAGEARRAAAVVYHNRMTQTLILDAYGFSEPLLDDGTRYEQAFTLINYEFLRLAFELGVERASLGESENTMTAGSFYYKRQWGMEFEVRPEYYLRHAGFRVQALSRNGWARFYQRPVLRDLGAIKQMVLALPSADYSPDQLLQQARRGLLKEHCSLRVLLPEGVDPEPFRAALAVLAVLEQPLTIESYPALPQPSEDGSMQGLRQG